MITLMGIFLGVGLVVAGLLAAAVSLHRGLSRATGRETACVPGDSRATRRTAVRAPVAPPATVPVLSAPVSGLTKAEAEELLDWLEVHGHADCELTYEEATGFTVRRP